MTDIKNKLIEIYIRLTADMPLFIKSGIESFLSLFLFALVLFFIFLLLQMSLNLVFKKGSRILPYGACLVALMIVFCNAFAITPAMSSTAKPLRIKLESYIGSIKQDERYLFISEREKAINVLRASLTTRSLQNKIVHNREDNYFILTLIFDDGIEQEITLNKSSLYLQPLPQTGQVMRNVSKSSVLYEYISQLKI